MTDKQKSKALTLLKSNEIYNLSIIGFIEDNPIEKFVQKANSFFVKGLEGEKWIYFSSNNADEFKELVKEIDTGDKYFGALDNWMIPHVTKNKTVDWLVNAYQFHFPDNAIIPESKIQTQILTTKDSEFIISQSLYKEMLSVKYLNERISKSVSAGVFEQEKLIGWGLTHDDGSLGSLHVLEEFRGKGYAKEITISLLKKCRKIDKIPFLQCEIKNIPAQNLIEKIGFVKDRNVSWLKLK